MLNPAACACFNLRKATRAVTQLFDGILEPSGLRATQFPILGAVSSAGPETISRLAKRLVMDRTTLTRDLKPLQREGLVEVVPGEDRRTRMVRLTKRGREALGKAVPLWREAQARIVEGLGPKRLRALLADLSETVAVTKRE
ncbi:MAG: MarR family winged helix-turn-helix transcriptional regulator [Nitrospinota bacterium]